MDVTVGICAYNEEANLRHLLDAILSQKLEKVSINKIIVVSSGSTDKTDEIASSFADRGVGLIREKERKGKVSAINKILLEAKTPIIILISADVLPKRDTFEFLCAPLRDSRIGICGARPMPTNSCTILMGFVSHVVWDLHHQIALNEPKMGECIAFRNIIKSLPPSAVDEEEISSIILKKGYKARYVPSAIVHNKGPETISDFIAQRRRIYAGHLALRKKTGHAPPTMGNLKVLLLILGKINLKDPFRTGFAIMLEGIARSLGYWDYLTGRKHNIWQSVKTTKQLNS